MSPQAGWRADMVDAAPKSSYVRCPDCYARISVDFQDEGPAALYAHTLSGRCRAHVPPKPIKRPPRRKPLDRTGLNDADWNL